MDFTDFRLRVKFHKAINVRNLSWCIIKRGRYCAFEDDHGRTIRDRLHWQAILGQRLAGKVPVQQVIDFIEDPEDTFLVLEYLDGNHIGSVLQQLNPRSLPWSMLSMDIQQRILGLFIEILKAVGRFHATGIIHRDLTEGNILLVPRRGVFMAYDVFDQRPFPPFYPSAPAWPGTNKKYCRVSV